MSTEPIIAARGLSKKFGQEIAVDNLNFEVPPGTLLGLIGPSGCGKTTTVRLLTGLYTATAGEVTVLGQAPNRFSSIMRRRIGYMPQQFVLYPDLSVWENLNFVASLYGLGPRRVAHMEQLLDFVALSEHRRKLARNLSGGMQRRLGLAAALTHNPELIFLDEPTAGIDPVLRRKIWDYLAAIKKQGRTFVLTTQYVGEAADCDLIGVMKDGRLLMVETLEGLRRRAQGGEVVEIHTPLPLDYQTMAALQQMPWMAGPVHVIGDRTAHLTVTDAGTAVPAFLAWAQEQGLEVESVEKHERSLDDIFVDLVAGEPTNA